MILWRYTFSLAVDHCFCGRNWLGLSHFDLIVSFFLDDDISTHDLLVGNDGNVIEPNFLNLMATVVNRAGTVYIRVGGNTQETAVLEPQGLPNNAAIYKSNTVRDLRHLVNNI